MGMALPYEVVLLFPYPGLLCCCSPLREDKPVLGVIGCMAERLKSKLFEEKAVDIIAGPDALRSVPGLVDLFCQVKQLGVHLLYTCALACNGGLTTNGERKNTAMRPDGVQCPDWWGACRGS